LNQADTEDFPPNLLKDVEFIWVDSIEKVLREALESG
jgi:ATP-dependent Lon protease